jgi:hypothetical protein
MIEKYKTILRVFCSHRTQRSPPNFSAAEKDTGREAEPPPLQDPKNIIAYGAL